MASRLTGVYRKLKWSDFRVFETVPAGIPANVVAETLVSHTELGGDTRRIAGAGGSAIFEVADNLVINVFLQTNTWRLASLSRRTGAQQAWLIKHEQGHYDIYALLARDFYYRAQAMIGVPFSSNNALINQVNAHRAATLGREDAIQKAYDADTESSQNRSEQWAWWSAIERASQLHRSPLVTGPDGRYLRIELADALAKAGLG